MARSGTYGSDGRSGGLAEMVVFLFLVVALVVVVGAVTLAVVGGGDDGVLPDAAPERWSQPLAWDRPLVRDDIEALRFPTALRGYRMADVDEALGRLGAELAERDARIAQLESAVHRAAPQPPPGGYGATEYGATEYGTPRRLPHGPGEVR